MVLSKSAVGVLCLLALGAHARRHPREYYEQKFIDWMLEHALKFEDGNEFVRRLEIWADNEDFILEQNSKGLPYELGHNKFSHLSLEEFHQRFHLGKYRRYGNFTAMREHSLYTHTHTTPLRGGKDVPDEVDWTTSNAVTKVKDQGQCGSCWAFSTTGALEGAYSIFHDKLVSFSEQELVDCDAVDAGCNGGLMDNAFGWIKKNGGLATEDAYPYKGHQGTCQRTNSVTESQVKGFVDVAPTDEALTSAIAQQPVSVAIEADQLEFQLYKSGVFTGSCGTHLDHGVLAVGYGTQNNVDFYKVKNSWGPSWGQDGYIYLERNKKQKGGQCGILLAPSFPQL